MAYKSFCDRCKQDISEGVGNNDNEFHFTKKRRTAFGYDKCLHLCDNCLELFDLFMKK